MNENINGGYASINDAIQAIGAARLDWANSEEVFAQLGIALRAAQKALDKAGVAKRKEAATRRVK